MASARVLERGDHWGIGRLYSLVTGSVLPYGPEKGFGKTMGLAPYGAVHPGPVLDFSPRDQGMSSDYSAFFSRPPLPRVVAKGVQQMRGPRARARSVLRARGVRRPAGMRTADGPDGRVRLRADRQPEPLYRGRDRTERSGQRAGAPAIAIRERLDPARLLRHRPLARPGAVGVLQGRRGYRALLASPCR